MSLSGWTRPGAPRLRDVPEVTPMMERQSGCAISLRSVGIRDRTAKELAYNRDLCGGKAVAAGCLAALAQAAALCAPVQIALFTTAALAALTGCGFHLLGRRTIR